MDCLCGTTPIDCKSVATYGLLVWYNFIDCKSVATYGLLVWYNSIDCNSVATCFVG